MAKYGINYYGSSKYGASTKLTYSVDPMSILVLDFDKINISWQTPKGTFTRFRLVRSQVGFPETAEDGVIIHDEFATEGTLSISNFIDGLDNPDSIPLVAGRQVYYRAFLFTSTKVWGIAGSIAAILPSVHGAQTQLMEMLPKVFTTSEQSPLGAVNQNSALYDFMYGLSFTHEVSLTLLDLLRPSHSGLDTPYQLIPDERANVGLIPEPALPTRNQKRLIREAIFMYTNKGTKNGIETYAEALTGFAPTLTVSANLLLTVQDSTFYKGVGNWVITGGTLAESNEQVPATGDNVIDNGYTGKVIASGSGSIKLGEDNPITKGVPVEPNTEYTVSCKLKSPPSSGNVTLSVRFYDKNGIATSSSHSATSVAANNTWKSSSVTATSDASSYYAVITIAFSAAGTYYFDQVCMQLGNTASYDEARALDIFLSPTKTNFINNPSFETNVTDSWTLDGLASASQDSDVSNISYSGTKSAKVTATGAWTLTSNSIPIEYGNYYTASALVKSSSDLTINFIGRDINGDVIVSHVDSYPAGTVSDWSVISATDLIGPEETDVVSYDIQFAGNSGTFFIDCVQFEKGPKNTDYFDGSLVDTAWESTANNSYSYLYVNKNRKVPRLGQTLNDWVPENLFWRLRTYDGVEYTSITV